MTMSSLLFASKIAAKVACAVKAAPVVIPVACAVLCIGATAAGVGYVVKKMSRKEIEPPILGNPPGLRVCCDDYEDDYHEDENNEE